MLFRSSVVIKVNVPDDLRGGEDTERRKGSNFCVVNFFVTHSLFLFFFFFLNSISLRQYLKEKFCF